jgi:hypothetical protein
MTKENKGIFLDYNEGFVKRKGKRNKIVRYKYKKKWYASRHKINLGSN